MFEDFNKISIPTTKGIRIYSFSDIFYCEAIHKVTEIYFNSEKSRTVNCSLSDFEKKLPINLFFRCHRSYLVNLFCIKEFSQPEGNKLILHNGSQVKLSRRKKKEFYNKLKNLQNTISISH